MPTILIVELDDDLRSSLAELLDMDGWTTLIATTPAQAVNIARGIRPNVVLADLFAPLGSDEPELKRTFERDPDLSAIPLLFMTCFPPDLAALGSERVLLKPFHPENLFKMLNRLAPARPQ